MRWSRDEDEKRKITMDRLCRIAAFKWQDAGNRTRKKKKKSSQDKKGQSVGNFTEAKQESISNNEINWENWMPQRGHKIEKLGTVPWIWWSWEQFPSVTVTWSMPDILVQSLSWKAPLSIFKRTRVCVSLSPLFLPGASMYVFLSLLFIYISMAALMQGNYFFHIFPSY